MPKEIRPGKPTTRRYSDDEKAQAVRLVRQLRSELGTEYGSVQRVAEQLGYGVETVRSWVKRADVDDGLKAETSSEDRAEPHFQQHPEPEHTGDRPPNCTTRWDSNSINTPALIHNAA